VGALLFDNNEAKNLGIQERTTESNPESFRGGKSEGGKIQKRTNEPKRGRSTTFEHKEGVNLGIQERKVEKWGLEVVWRGVEAENGCAQLYAFTRISRLLSLVSGR